MSYIPTEDYRVARDLESNGLVSTNAIELNKHRSMRQRTKTLAHQQQNIDQRFMAMDNRLDRCEQLLQELVKHISTLVTNSSVE